MIRVERLSKTYGQVEALQSISFHVPAGQVCGYLGPNGAGKTTTVRILTGVLQQTSGEVSVNRERLGYVFQDATLMEWRTVQGNVELLAELQGFGVKERKQKAAEAIELVGLRGFENHYPKSLSGGMKMRVSLARTLTLDPPVFLFDEPFGALDEITRERLNEETLKLFEKERFAGLFITHSISEAVFLSTRVHVMSARPGTLIATFDVPFDYPRDPDLRFEKGFRELSREVSHALLEAHA